MRRSVWMRVLAAVLIISMLAAPVSAAARRPSPSYGTNCIVGGIISIIRDIIRDIWDDWFDVPGDEDPEPTPPEQPTDPSEPTEPGETEPEDPTEPEETLKTVLNLIEGHANTANGHLLRGVTYSLSQLDEEQSKPTPGSLRDIKAIAIGAARAAAPTAQLNAVASSVQTMAEVDITDGLVAHYDFETVNGTTVTSNVTTNTTAELKNGASVDENGYIGNAMKLDSNQHGMQLTNTVNAAETSFSISMWYKLNSTSTVNVNLAQAGTTGGSSGRTILILQPDSTYKSYLTAKDSVVTKNSVERTEWQHITFVYDKDNSKGYFYINGVADNAAGVDMGSTAPVSISDMIIGRHRSAEGACDGLIDEVRIYNKVLSAEEAAAVYNYGSTDPEEPSEPEQPVVDPADDSRDIPTSVLTATAGDSQSGEGPELVLDDNTNTLWHTNWYGTSRDNHWIQFELNGDYNVDGLRYLPRQGTDSSNGIILEYKIQVSDDGENFRDVASGNWENDRNWKIAQFESENVKYVRLVAVNATTDNSYVFASAAEIRLTGEEIETIPVEPEQPAIGSEVVFFPVTMFNYNNGISELNDDDIMRTLTHQAEVEAGLKEKWEGLYFSGGKPAPTSYTYTTEAASHSDLTWQQVMDGTYYADEACTSQAVVTEIIEGSGDYQATKVNVGDIWTAFGGNTDDTWYPTTYKHLSSGSYYTVAIQRPAGVAYYLLGYQGNPSMPDIYYQIGYYNASDKTELYTVGGTVTGYNLVAGGQILATLEGTDLSAKVGVPLYTAAGEVTVNKSYAEWNWWAYETDGDAARNKFYAGLVQDELVDGELKFNVAEPGIFTFDSAHPEITNDGIKDIYQHVGLPFVKNAEGYYTFDSDANGTYFADTNGDGKSDPWYGAEDDFFNMYLDYGVTQGWDDMYYGDGSTNLWAPYNTNANDTGEGAIDYHFGMRADIPFSMTPNGRIKSNDDNSEPITFTFKGDDDVWIFIDGHLVIDLGGIHNRLGATIDFANNTITYFKPESNTNTNEFGAYNVEDFELVQKLYNDADGEGALGQTRANFSTVVDHEMSIFYLERGKGTSNCQIEFNLPMLDTILVTKDITHSWSALQDAQDGPDKDGTAPLTAKEQAAVDKLDFDFKLWKKEIGGRYTAVANTNYYLLDKDDNVLGIYTTGADGVFSLKNGQTAMFLTDLGNGAVTYAVEELDLDLDTFLTPDYKYAGLATNGFDFYGETLNNDTEDENDTKLVEKHLDGNASGIGEQELPMNAERLVSYDVTPYGSIEAIESLEFICTNYLNAELPNPTARAYEDIIVIDYGLPVQVDPLHNDLFRGDDIEIVAWGDETLELNEVLIGDVAVEDGTEGGTSWSGEKFKTVAYVSNGTSYNTEAVELADCLYTFNKTEDGYYEVSATAADGTKVYLNHYSSGNNNPNVTTPGKIEVTASTEYENMFKLLAMKVNVGSGDNCTLHFHAEAAMPYWNRCGNDPSTRCREYLYRPVQEGEESSEEIIGYVMVTDIAEVVDGGQYLIVHDSEVDDNLYILHPSTSTGQWDHVAKLGNTNTGAVSFDSGNVTFNDVTYAETVNADGTITFTRDSFEYELTEQLTEVEEIRYIIKVTSTRTNETTGLEYTACRYALGKVYIVPATIMYYEENFSDMVTFTGSGWNSDATVADQDNVSAYQEPGVAGTVTDSTYGSDVAYLSDDGDSNGTYRFGDTTNGAIRFTYTFTGTGSSIFARTSANTGYMQVKLYRGTEITDEALEDITYRDTYWKDENGTQLDANGTLYNIPVYSTSENLDYDTYTVVCTIAKKGTITAGNDTGAGNEFYLDGIRVLRPLDIVIEQNGEWDDEGNLIQPIVYDELTTKALDAYADDGETNLDVVTLRQKLITDYDYLLPEEDENGEVVGEKEQNWPFAVLTDVEGKIVLASDYISIGPKNEVYLSKETSATNGQSVTFSLKYWQPEGLKLYMGMKAPFGHASVNVGHENIELNNAPDCYYDVTNNHASLEEKTDEDGNTYYVVTYTFEAAESIVSLTNIKVVGNYEFLILEQFDGEFDGSAGDGNG